MLHLKEAFTFTPWSSSKPFRAMNISSPVYIIQTVIEGLILNMTRRYQDCVTSRGNYTPYLNTSLLNFLLSKILFFYTLYDLIIYRVFSLYICRLVSFVTSYDLWKFKYFQINSSHVVFFFSLLLLEHQCIY